LSSSVLCDVVLIFSAAAVTSDFATLSCSFNLISSCFNAGSVASAIALSQLVAEYSSPVENVSTLGHCGTSVPVIGVVLGLVAVGVVFCICSQILFAVFSLST
jgi:hypothetical protein